MTEKTMKKMPVEDWYEQNDVTKLLKQNLECNIRVMCDRMPKDERDSLLRLQLIMIRQTMVEFGVEL